MKTQATIARVFVNHCLGPAAQGPTSTPPRFSMAKYWITEVENKIIDEGAAAARRLWLHETKYPIARMLPRPPASAASFGGSNEIMKVLIARTLES